MGRWGDIKTSQADSTSISQVIGCKKELETLLVRFFASSQPTKSWDLFLIELHMKWQAKCKCRALSGLTLNV